MIRKLVAAFVMILFAASLHSTAFAEFIPVDGDKTRDYLKDGFKVGDIVRVTGLGVAQPNWKNFYKNQLRQAAHIDAVRQFVEIIDGVQAEIDKNNPDLIISQTSHESKAFKLLEKNARVINVEFLDGGGCAVTMELVFPTDWKR